MPVFKNCSIRSVVSLEKKTNFVYSKICILLVHSILAILPVIINVLYKVFSITRKNTALKVF